MMAMSFLKCGADGFLLMGGDSLIVYRQARILLQSKDTEERP
jgi:hypothetical protein